MAQKLKIRKLDQLDHEFGESIDGVRFVPCLCKGELPNIDATYITIEKGKEIHLHNHRKTKCLVFVVEGHAMARFGRKKVKVIMNDFIFIPPHLTHGFKAIDVPVTLFAVHTPSIYKQKDSPDIHYVSHEKR